MPHSRKDLNSCSTNFGAAVAIFLSREESFELLSDDAVEDGFFGSTREVFKRGALHGRGRYADFMLIASSNVSNQLQTHLREEARLFSDKTIVFSGVLPISSSRPAQNI